MKVFIAGATGVLGRRVVPLLRDRGHDVVGLSRGSEIDTTLRSLGAQPIRADLFDVGSLARAAEGADVIVRAATAIPPGARWRGRDWATNDRIRREGTQALTACTARVHAKLYVQESIVWAARPPDGSEFDETSPASPGLWFASAIDAERIAREAGIRGGFRVATLRFGGFYSSDSSQTRFMGERLARRRLPILGRGNAVWSNLHVDDAATALVGAIGANQDGLWHVVDDRPVRTSEFFTTFARLLGAPEPRRLPTWIARLAVGGGTVRFLTASTRTSNARIRKDLDWVPHYPTCEEGLRQVVDAWKAEGFPGLSEARVRTPSGAPGRP
ncbi:MAG TPA: NAD(P)-dependent oxidoreductase [Thermoplasmata archaeon]|nr:NAD(P)-dependent oxidoreductase [Thermoplasmata archaeon]